MDFSLDGADITTESGLTAEDFFPMKITIPKIELEYVVLEGTDSATLKKGAGHESVTPLPGKREGAPYPVTGLHTGLRLTG